MPAALTLWAASRVPVYLDTPEMDSPVQVSHVPLIFAGFSIFRWIFGHAYKLQHCSAIALPVTQSQSAQ